MDLPLYRTSKVSLCILSHDKYRIYINIWKKIISICQLLQLQDSHFPPETLNEKRRVCPLIWDS